MSDNLEMYTKLAQVGQEHLLKFWPELTSNERKLLKRDIDELKLDEIKQYFDRATISMNENDIKLDNRLQPIPDGQILSIIRTSEIKLNMYREEGLQQISQSRVAVLLMAGGQGEFSQKPFPSILHHYVIWINES